jgi:hypothetical protein
MVSEVGVLLGDPRSEHVRLTAFGRERPASGDYDDDNWLIGRVALAVSGFRADYPASLRSDDFDQLRKILRSIRSPGSDGLNWEPMEPWIELTFATGGDVVEVRGVATERIGYGNSLRFVMPLSVVSIDRALDDLDELLTIFPVPEQPSTA